MRYIKFLKPPSYALDKKTKRSSVSTVIAITSDLGDKFYNADLTCKAIVQQVSTRKGGGGGGAMQVVAEVHWKAGMRALKVEVPFNFAPGEGKVATIALTAHSPPTTKGCPLIVADSLAHLLSTSPPIISAISHPFSLDGSKPEALAARRLLPKEGVQLEIWENSGTTIEHLARHIWDAGVAFCVSIASKSVGGEEGRAKKRRKMSNASTAADEDPFGLLLETLDKSTNKILLELGSGVGVSGLTVAKLYSDWKVHLTDLPEAAPLIEKNISTNHLPNASFTTLDWFSPLPDSLPAPSIVLISDCTYNPDTAAPLVKTLEAVAGKNADVLVFLAYKRRHEDEKVFFEEVERGFECVARRVRVLVSDDGFEDEELRWVVYRWRGR